MENQSMCQLFSKCLQRASPAKSGAFDVHPIAVFFVFTVTVSPGVALRVLIGGDGSRALHISGAMLVALVNWVMVVGQLIRKLEPFVRKVVAHSVCFKGTFFLFLPALHTGSTMVLARVKGNLSSRRSHSFGK